MSSVSRLTIACAIALGAAACRDATWHEFLVAVPGGHVAVSVAGSGSDTVVALHAGPGLHSRYLREALQPLTRSRVVVLYDQLGRGRSAFVPAESLSLARDVRDLEAVRAHFRLDSLMLMAHGYGAALALAYAEVHPGRIARAVLVTPFFPRVAHYWALGLLPYPSPDSLGLADMDAARLAGAEHSDPVRFCRRYWGVYLSPAPVRDGATLQRLAAAMCDAPPEVLRAQPEIARAVQRSFGEGFDWRQRMAALTAPVLLIRGAEANPAWERGVDEWSRFLPNDRRLVVPGPVQFPWLGDEPAFHAGVRDFLDGGWPAAAVASVSDSTSGT